MEEIKPLVNLEDMKRISSGDLVRVKITKTEEPNIMLYQKMEIKGDEFNSEEHRFVERNKHNPKNILVWKTKESGIIFCNDSNSQDTGFIEIKDGKIELETIFPYSDKYEYYKKILCEKELWENV